MDIPEPLTSSFRNFRSIVLKHFDHINLLIINCDFPNYLHNSMLQSAWYSLIKPTGISSHAWKKENKTSMNSFVKPI